MKNLLGAQWMKYRLVTFGVAVKTHSMVTLAQKLGITAPVSALLRKARALGIKTLEDAISLAIHRGCRHYPSFFQPEYQPTALAQFSNQELVTLLLLGENPYNPTAIRCAAQLIRSPGIEPRALAHMARQACTVRPLAHIARSGFEHDPSAADFWRVLLKELQTPPRPEPHLPHWSRFVSIPGYQKHGAAQTTWLTPLHESS